VALVCRWLTSDPIVSFTVYDIVKSIYSSTNHLEDVRSRVSAIQNTLSQLRVTNIATLDALTQHFGRLIDITKSDEEYVSDLAQSVSYCWPQLTLLTVGLCRPRVESSMTQHDRHAQRLLIDLITQREKIFAELKRQSIKKARPESLDESQRRVRYEARSRAVSAAAKSPRIVPTDNLTNGGEKASTHIRRVSGISGILGNRPPTVGLELPEPFSLDVGMPTAERDEVLRSEGVVAPVEVTVTDEQGVTKEDEGPAKRLSLGRSGRVTGARTLQRSGKRMSVQPVDATEERHGFTLTDNPVQD
jgi:hypothetical protein